MIDIRTKSVQTKTKLVLDSLIFVAFLICMDPRSSGLAGHEWLATAALAAIFVHVLLSWDWILQTSRRVLGPLNLQTRLNYLLNWALFFDVCLLMISGLAISERVLPSVGLSLPRAFAWRPLHDLSANLFMVILGLHTALHWSWIVNAFQRYVFRPFTRRSSPGSAGLDSTGSSTAGRTEAKDVTL